MGASVQTTNLPHPNVQTLPRGLFWGTVRDRYDNVVQQHCGDFRALFHFIQTSQRHTTTKNGQGLLASTFRVARHPDPTSKYHRRGKKRWRKMALVESVGLLMFDVDGASCLLADVLAAFAGVACIHWSTYSHGVPGKGLRARLVLELTRPVSVEEHRVLYQWGLDRLTSFGVDALDTGCRDATRLMYLPGIQDPRATETPWLAMEEGAPLDPDELPGQTSVGALLDAQEQARRAREAERAGRLRHARARRRRLRRHGLGATLEDQAKDGAQRHLDTLCEQLEALAAQRHDDARRLIYAAVAACADTLGDAHVAHALFESAHSVFAARKYGRTELQRLVHGALRKAPRRAWRVNVLTRPCTRPHTPTHARAQGQTGDASPSRDHTEEVRDVEEAAHALRRVLTELFDHERSALIVDPGAGKSYVTALAALILAAQGRSIVVAVPTNRFKRETLALYQQLAGDMDQLGLDIRLSLTRDETNCARFDELKLVAPLAPDAAHRFCARCPFNLINDRRTSCSHQRARTEAQAKNPKPDILITTHALLSGDDPPTGDILIIDESPLSACEHTAAWSASQLGDLVLEQGVVAHNTDALHRLRRTIKEAKRDTLLLSDELRALCPADSLTIPANNYDKARMAAAQAGSHGDTTDAIKGFMDWRDIEALRATLDHDWNHAAIDKGALRCVLPRPLPLERFGQVLYLDATTTPELARVLLGPDTEVRQLHVPAPVQVRHAYLPVDLGKHSGVDGDKKADRKRRGDIWKALHELTDSPETLHVTLKARREEGWTRAFLNKLQGPVIHFGGQEAKASNDFGHCRIVVVDTWHVPQHAVRSLARALQALAATRGDDRDHAWWLEQARWQLVGALVTQAIERVRTRRAHDGRPVLVITTGPLGPVPGDRLYGLPIHDVIDPAELAFLAGHTTYREAHVVARTITAALGGVWSPTLTPAEGMKDLDLDAAAQTLDVFGVLSKRRVRQRVSLTLPAFAEKRLSGKPLRWGRDHGAGAWGQLALRGQLQATELTTSRGRRPWILLHDRPLDDESITSLLEGQRCQWYRLGSGPRVSCGVGLLEALAQLEDPTAPMSELVCAVAETMGCSRASVYRCLTHEAEDSELPRKTLERLWRSQQPDPEAVCEDDAAWCEHRFDAWREVVSSQATPCSDEPISGLPFVASSGKSDALEPYG